MARIVRLSRPEYRRAEARVRPEPGFWRELWAAPLERLALLVAFVSMAYVASFFLAATFDTEAVPQGRTMSRVVHFAECIGVTRVTCVVDGDTLWLEGSKIRIADIDTPEVSNPSCATELALGQAATARLTVLLNQGPFDILPYERDTDVYGRKLRILSRDGHSLGGILVAEGLARVWDGSRHSWCG